MAYKSYLAIIAAGAFASGAAFGAGAQYGGQQQTQGGSVQQPPYQGEETAQQADVQPSIGQDQGAQGMQAALSDDAVRQLQQKLKDEGYYQEGDVDGIWGPKTEQAVQSFQESQGIESSGQLNAQTVDALGLSDQAEFAQFMEQHDQGIQQDGAMQQDQMQQDQGMQQGGGM